MRSELVVIRAADETALVNELSRLVAFLDRVPDARIIDIACTCSRSDGECALCVIAEDNASLRARLASARDRIATGKTQRIKDKSGTYYFREHLIGNGKGKLAFVFPGVMSFYPDMLKDLAIDFSMCRAAFNELEEALCQDSEFTPSSFVFPPAAYYRRDANIFKSGAYAQTLVAVYTACIALARFMSATGIKPDGVVGFAGGDLAAMCCSGTSGELNRAERIKLIEDIYRIVAKAVNHGGFEEVAVITVIMRHADDVVDIISDMPVNKVMLAVDFSPRQKTYVVAKDIETEFTAKMAEYGIRVRKLGLDRPFNTIKCKSLVPAIRKFVTDWMKHSAKCDSYSCASAGKVPEELKSAREDVAGRWAKPVRFEETTRQMYEDGYRVFLEVGPRGLMSAAIADTLRGENFATIALDSIHRRGSLQLQHALGQLIALGAKMDLSVIFEGRGAKVVDFDSVISMEVRKESEMLLYREFPKLIYTVPDAGFDYSTSVLIEPKVRGSKAALRAAAVANRSRRQQQLDFGVSFPLIAGADQLSLSPGISGEIAKVLKLSEMPFLNDFALGTSQLSYSDPNLRGMVPLALTIGIEIMAEMAQTIVANRMVTRIEDVSYRRLVSFANGELRLLISGERVPSGNDKEIAVKVLVRDDKPNGEYTWPVMEATIYLAEVKPSVVPVTVQPLFRPRSVHWSGRDIYPMRLSCGKRLRGIQFVEAWSEAGLDYEIDVPPYTGNLTFTRFPAWSINPLLLETVIDGFSLWRSQGRDAGSFSTPFRLRRLDIGGFSPQEGSRLRCYLRLTGVTERSHICDITVSDGNGNALMRIAGWEDLTERVPVEYRNLILQPAMSYLTETLPKEFIGATYTDASSAFLTDIPYHIFDRNNELWLKVVSHIVLNAEERRDFLDMTGSTSRRTEWLFGRIAAKEAIRRYLKDFYQARWSDADIHIWPDDLGKPHAIGDWTKYMTTKLDIAIAHTAQFVVAIAAANSLVGIDVESTNRNLSEEFANGVFTTEELELATQSVNVSQTVIKFWCAKEAVSKALGTGIRYSPKEMVVRSYDADIGKIGLQLEGEWVNAFKKLKGRDIMVTVKVLRDHALASCFIPMAMINEEDRVE